MAHTPGPWQCRPTHRYIGEFVVGAIDCDIQASDAADDAALISAAPMMFDALKAVKEWLESFSVPPTTTIAEKQECLAIINAALAHSGAPDGGH